MECIASLQSQCGEALVSTESLKQKAPSRSRRVRPMIETRVRGGVGGVGGWGGVICKA